MTSEPLPRAAEPEYLTEALRRSGALGDGCVNNVVVENSRDTILSRIIWLGLSYNGPAAEAPGSIILKTGLPERADALWIQATTRSHFTAAVAISVIVHGGFAGLSIQISLVRPGCTAAASSSVALASTKSTTTPRSAAEPFSQLRSPQYMSCGATTWSPSLSARNTAVAAAIPDAKVRLAAPPSSLVQQRFRLNECWVCRPAIGIACPVLVVGIADESAPWWIRRSIRAPARPLSPGGETP
jgi:hypothetical protein